ncbi:hypothetical protein [Natrinema saccharevitans]|uniref:hypothetical protein n=1 Tax=Natrinema saccharevitans TaxID=301967 RepID=UPI00158970E6|nr:hypothetical protein [Natrinema saccharevitans]
MFDNPSNRGATRLATLCIALVLAGAVFGAITPAAAATGTQADNATNTSSPSTTPSQADLVRITPDNPDEDYLSVQTETTDEVYNTTGPYATFTLSEPVESARVQQSKADARVLGGGRVVRIAYEDDAAGKNASLYTAELFFPDGSQRSIDLYATQTGVSVAAGDLEQYEGFIDYTLEQAGSEGYDQTPEGARSYLETKEERANLFDSLFTEHVMMFISLLFAAARNFVTWVVAVAIIAGVAFYFERKHGWILRLQQKAESRGELIREAVRQTYEERRNTAAKHPLEDVTEIGPNAARYWRETGVETVNDMVEMTCKGVVALTEDGNVKYDENGDVVYAHHGVDDLMDVDPLTLEQLRSETWLAPVIYEGRLTPTTALSNIESALMVAEKDYNRGNEVRDARRKVSELNKRLAGRRDFENRETSSNAPRHDQQTDFTGTAAGGD